ncbi:hypothetical protein IscW_ISCW019472 [Ixodes scapularis]|uniref:Uncharacterized protein n=1 Tax=Ixodes scapularis TaxID=6945 RepID=B7PSF2_IXOSC|nr:hypothetical protein IscW_ISCW019472 [Ixodes scapularis]|eukprot:XP_002402409.1 hypothetical protein IscW_ISCW019472 [Ixodes scapularis]
MCAVDDCGITSPISKAELIAAIEATKKKSALGHDGITYGVFKNFDGSAVDNLLEAQVSPTSSDHLGSLMFRIPLADLGASS